MNGADRPDWGPEEEEKEEEEKEERENLHRGNGGGSHCRAGRGAEGRGWGLGSLSESAHCFMGRIRVSLQASGLPFFPPTRETGWACARRCGPSKAAELSHESPASEVLGQAP